MLKKLFNTCFASLLGCCAVNVYAQLPDPDVVYLDHPLLDGFAYSEIVEYEYQEDVNHRVVLGSLQRTQREVIAEDSELLRGNVTKILYEVSQEFSGADAYEFFRDQMVSKGYEESFACSGSACGSSNYWANDIFRNRILYGPERNQYYLAMETNLGLEVEPRISIYIITRGNRRIYAYVEIVEVGGVDVTEILHNTEALLIGLRTEGSIILPSVEFDANDQLLPGSDVSTATDLLENDLSLNVYVVAHLSQLMQRSRVRANSVRQALINAGIAAGRIVAEGVGPLAPNCAATECENRIELVLQ